MLFQREIKTRIQRLASQFPVVVVTGARQVGKTTLLRSEFPHHGYVTLDLPSQADFAESEPASFWKRNPAPVVVDEIQQAPRLFRSLKSAVDRSRHEMGQYILTGSQKFPLMKEVSESLAGRAAVLELETLSLQELGAAADARSSWARVLARGTYPELWRQPELRPEDFFSSYLATYLERDVRQILNVSSLRDFERFLRAAAARSGQLLNKTELARDVGIAGKTAGEWIGVLQASHQVFLLEPYFENVGKRLTKSPKLFLHDSGLLCFLLGLDETTLPKSPLLGAVWETFVFSELRKRAAASEGPAQTLWFYRDAAGVEVDFLKVSGGKIDLIECKWAERPDDRAIGALSAAASQLKKSRAFRVGESIVICRAEAPFAREGVRFLDPLEWPR